ncbi:MAG: hypothetical protein V1739_00820 [Candidatus Omnitrophota bacterium]
MKVLKNQKGTILVATYIVLSVIIVVASAFFTLVVTNNKAVVKANNGARALSYAEKGIAYVYFESYNLGWDWYTHEWNGAKNKLIKIPAADRLKSRDDCEFDDSTGFYVHNSGEFMVKAYPDLVREDDTIVVSMGICAGERRVIMYYLTRRGIYDFFVFSPYNLDLYGAVGRDPKMNGGGIHSNGDISVSTYMRLEDVSELSAGENGSIYYTSSQYAAPYYADVLDGVMDGRAPITRLDNLANLFRNDIVDPMQSGPFGYYNSAKAWGWKSYAYYFVRDSMGYYPTDAFSNTDAHFTGSDNSRFNINPGAWDGTSGTVNNSSEPLNVYNLWIKPYELDEDGNKIAHVWAQMPAELDEEWAWDKYIGSRSSSEQPTSFYTYNNSGTAVDVANTYWEILGPNNVVMLDPPIGGTAEEWAAFNLAHPSAKQYWDMYKAPDYWQAVRGNSYYGTYLNEEAMDGTYGNDRAISEYIDVKHTNSMKQPSAWEDFLKDSGLDGFVRDGNTGGEYLTPPDFEESYSRLAEKDGVIINLDAEYSGGFANYDEWQAAMERSIDIAVDMFNDGNSEKGIAKKVEFINTFTGKWNVVLELDLEKMQQWSKYPHNGILYTKVPIRITNASELARAREKYGFTVLGEENIYLQGDYNTVDWVTSAIISQKRVFTLSDDFNDPQVAPAPQNYPDYPYIYVKDNGTGTFAEVPYASGGGSWVYSGYLDNDGVVDIIDYYPQINDANERSLLTIIGQKNTNYRAVFNKDDPTGAATDTWTWSGTGETYTSGMMANKVTKNQTLNCLIASNRWLGSYQSDKGDILESWGGFNRIFNGSYFVLEYEGFTAANSEFVDYSTSSLGYNNRGRRINSDFFWGAYYLSSYYANESIEYDERFKTATRAPSDVFFGGAESLWAEATEVFFYKTDF